MKLFHILNVTFYLRFKQENMCFCLDLESLSFSYNSFDGYQQFNYIFVNIQFRMTVKTTHFISLQIEFSKTSANQLSETPLILIIAHDDKIKNSMPQCACVCACGCVCVCVCVCVGGLEIPDTA